VCVYKRLLGCWFLRENAVPSRYLSGGLRKEKRGTPLLFEDNSREGTKRSSNAMSKHYKVKLIRANQ